MEELKRVIPTSLENAISLWQEGGVMVDIKTLPLEDKINMIKFALKYDELSDPLMIMNLINLVKVYNTLADEYFENSDIYVNSVEELLDLKLAVNKELKEFTRRISVYFLSLFKSYSKTAFTATDEHVALPKLYETLFNATDLLTLSGIFAKTPEISTNDLMYIDNSYSILSGLIMKGAETLNMMNLFFQDYEEQK